MRRMGTIFIDRARNLPGWMIVIALTAIVLITGMALTIILWDWLSAEESNSAVVRNVGLLLAGAIALIFAMWRGLVAERQADAARRQTLIARRQAGTARRQTNAMRRQANTAQHDLLNRRYQQGAEMLGNSALSVRLAGISALQWIAEDHPKEYHVQVLSLLCAFVRHPNNSSRHDVNYAMHAIAICHQHRDDLMAIESGRQFMLDLRRVDIQEVFLSHGSLYSANLYAANLRKSMLPNMDLHGAILAEADLTEADLGYTDLQGTILAGADLTNTYLANANLSGAYFSDDGDNPAVGLTQEQLDQAWADPEYPPRLDGVLDANTGKPLSWSGRATPLEAAGEAP